MGIARTQGHMIDSRLILRSTVNQKFILNLANRMPARQKLILTPTSDCNNLALSHLEGTKYGIKIWIFLSDCKVLELC